MPSSPTQPLRDAWTGLGTSADGDAEASTVPVHVSVVSWFGVSPFVCRRRSIVVGEVAFVVLLLLAKFQVSM